MNNIKIVDFNFNLNEFTFSLVINLWFLILLIIVYFLIILIVRKNKEKGRIHLDIEPVKFKYKISGYEVEYAIIRNFQNIEIAHRIYIELITRKAAIPIDKNDVILEVYNSWYSLFETTREELKKLSGEMLVENDISKDLIKLLSDTLNIGLRPHLTEHQAKFRKWYNNAITLDKNKNKTPQQIQCEYDDYNNLFKSMQEVNYLLIEYSKRLYQIVYGYENNS